MQTYQITLTAQQIEVIGAALLEMPMRLAAPVVAAINEQLEAARAKPSTEVEPE